MNRDNSDVDKQVSDSIKLFAQESLINEVREIIASDDLHSCLSALKCGQEVFSEELMRFNKTVKHTSLLAAFILWVDTKKSNDLMREEAMKLIKAKLINFKNDEDGSLLSLGTINSNMVSQQINSIRCQTRFTIAQRENLVGAILDFYRWLSTYTFDLIPKGVDPDIAYIERRKIDLPSFFLLMEGLEDKSRLIAKLLYYGRSKLLEEIVKIQIEDVDFFDQTICIEGVHVDYPPHVFQDIKELIKGRKTGPVFAGRNNSQMNSSTIFRHFQALGRVRGLENISPKNLTEDQ